jgi:peptidyl-prolyl cis-trans isomerase A (cyclophilin A)
MAMSNRIPRICAGVLLALPAFCLGQQAAPPPPADVSPPAEAQPAAPATVPVVMHTSMGDIHLALEVGRAPITAGNFLRYVDAKRFDGITFYRAMKVSEDGRYGLVQGGLSDPKLLYKPIAHESPATTGLSHVDGAISMGRNEPGSAVADFFIVIGNLVSMDGTADGKDPGYAVFGRVTDGMDLVHAILDLPRSETARNPVMQGQMLAEPVKILTVRRETRQ